MGGLKRVRYSEGLLLSARDYLDEQAYFLAKLRRHNQTLHGVGVVYGLQIRTVGYGVRVEPGMALDTMGNEIVIDEPVTLRLEDSRSAALYIVLRYAEIDCEPVPVVAPMADTAVVPSRSQESFELEIRREAPHAGGALLLARLAYRRGRWRVDRWTKVPHVRR